VNKESAGGNSHSAANILVKRALGKVLPEGFYISFRNALINIPFVFSALPEGPSSAGVRSITMEKDQKI